ncbi:ribosomal-protein-alanine N-acetyltransferase [Vagococcus martis]|uniref:[Ribosomal protein bS18]-alanine N-acetyltransferase n=1 Tax=Vagococcus martis TaxID=1768210 RepID=A0A1V4DE55_9ENTE|nr:ribosomal protein S18-alanine N-acetyltransferase [Vagococcus martis]OPF86834.1 ribosomal-protein-alanine N-acetyltransferase [Vagococcus martis]
MDNRQLAKRLSESSDIIFKYGSPWSEAQFYAQLAQKNSITHVKIEDDKVIGFIICQFVLDEAELLLIGVLPDYKNNGIASTLLTEACELLKQNNVSHLFLEVRSQNEEAIRFYKKHQFKELGVRKNYYHHPTDNAVMMQLEI